LVSSITGSPVQYAGGGGAGFYKGFGALPGLGGGGGGGNGGFTINTASGGLENTGGGGGGVSTDYTANGGVTTTGPAGGSGIVVIRYPSYLSQATSTTGSPTTYTSGPYRVYIFYASGTITF
jgi:hypothetical protein